MLIRSLEKEKRGCAISVENSWRTTVGHRMHISCCASAYQLLCKRTTAVVRPEILTVSTTYSISSNNIFYLFQQHILALPTTYPSSFNKKKRMYHQLMIHPLFRYIGILFTHYLLDGSLLSQQVRSFNIWS